jgi:hypothetical protein
MNRKLISELNSILVDTAEEYESIDEDYFELQSKIDKHQREIDRYNWDADGDEYSDYISAHEAEIEALTEEQDEVDERREYYQNKVNHIEKLIEEEENRNPSYMDIDGVSYCIIGKKYDPNDENINVVYLENETTYGEYDLDSMEWLEKDEKFIVESEVGVKGSFRITGATSGKEMEFYELENGSHWGFYNVTEKHWIYLESKQKETIEIDGETFKVENSFRAGKSEYTGEWHLEVLGEDYSGIYNTERKIWVLKDCGKSLKWNSTNIIHYVREYLQYY